LTNILLANTQYTEQELKFAEACRKVIFSQFSLLSDDRENVAKVDYSKLAKSVVEEDQEAIDQCVGEALDNTVLKIEKALEELQSHKMKNTVGGSHILAVLSFIFAKALISQEVPSLRRDINEEGITCSSDTSAYKSLVLGSLESVYRLAAQKVGHYDAEQKTGTVLN